MDEVIVLGYTNLNAASPSFIAEQSSPVPPPPRYVVLWANTSGVLNYTNDAGRVVKIDCQIEEGSYAGNSTDNRNITLTSPTFTPKMIWIGRSGIAGGAFRFGAVGDLSGSNDTAWAVWTNNRIQSISAGSFQIGNAGQVNTSGSTYYWVAIG